MADYSELTDEQLAAKLKSARAANITVMAIFLLIIVAWIVLGYWKTKVPVFISTMTLGFMSFIITSAAPRKIRAEIARRAETK